ncbi:MAG TPA: arylsulfatase [Fimbriimonadaceae bacterium]|nr:arylsulfatase [Fimbriimonadaceae bacterium]
MLSAVGLLALVSAQPNLIYIMADDLGYRELGCFGQSKIPTPHLDRLAKEGIRITRAYAGSPVCAPTRYSLLTGKHQGHAAIRGNKEQGGFGPNDKEGQTPVDQGEVLLSEVLKKGGYRTGIVGKWALGGSTIGQFPTEHGFDFFYGYLCQRRAHNFYPPYLWRNTDVDLLNNPVYAAHQKVTMPFSDSEEYWRRYAGTTYSAGKLADACVEFIRDKDRSKPFFLYYAPTLPHVALQAPKEWVNRFPREWDSKPYLGENGYLPSERPRATYAAMIAYLDHTVGQILEALEQSDHAKDTLIIFTSDNGATNVGGVDRDFFQSNGELRAGKMSLYEGGIRVPMVARWPGKIAPGTESDHPLTCYDAMSTLCEAAGVKAPKSDGLSYVDALVGKRQKSRPFLYFEYPEAAAFQAVIMGRYKVIRPNLKRNLSQVEVYDLEADPSEARDLASARPDLVREGLAIMRREHVRNNDFPLGLVDK